MNNHSTPIAVVAALFLAIHSASAQSSPPLPPSVIVDGTLMTGSGGSYSTANFQNQGSSASLNVDPSGAVTFSAAQGYWQPSYLMSAGYYVNGYTIPGYTIPGYWTDSYWVDTGGYYDDNGNWNSTGYWSDPVWVAEIDVTAVDIDGYYVPDQWSTPSWVGTGETQDTGAYAHFAFQMTNGTNVQPADSAGNAWSSAPQFGIPAIRVGQSSLYLFNAADTVSAYDYFSNAAGDGYLWVTAAYYGGYDPQLGAFSGTNSHAFFRDTSASGIHIIPRNSDGSFVSFGSPSYGPGAIWSNGFNYRYLTTDTTNGLDVYLEDMDATYVLVSSTGIASGLAVGAYANSLFQVNPAPTFAALLDGTPLPAGAAPHWGPPAIFVTDSLWAYRGSTANADYYGGIRPGQVLSIDANGAVFYSDRSLNISNASGLYAGGAFQNLPVVVRGINSDGTAWTALASSSTLPSAVMVGGHPWYYSSTQSTSTSTAYVGPQSGQILLVNNTTGQATLSDPTTGALNVAGTFAAGQFTFPGSDASVQTAKADGTPVNAESANTVAGNFDVSGNFTMGSWQPASGTVLNGFGLTFTASSSSNPDAQLQFGSTVALTDWFWTHAQSDGSATQVTSMALDKAHRVLLYDPNNAGSATVTLDPGSAGSAFHGPLRVQPQGDIPMGGYQNSPVIP